MAAYRDLIRESFEKQPVRTVAEAGERIFQLTGLRRGPSQVRKFAQGHGAEIPAGPRDPRAAQKNLAEHVETQAAFLDDRVEAAPGGRPGGTRSCVLRRRGPFRLRDVLVLPVVVRADLRPCGLGPSAVQRPGGVERGDAAS